MTKDELVAAVAAMPVVVVDATDAPGRVVAPRTAMVSRDVVLGLIGALDDEDDEGLGFPVSEGRAAVRGEVGTITGPAIIGTNDTTNGGPARVVEGDLIGDSEGVLTAAAKPRRWKPAGEVGVVTGAGASVVEEPKNDARPAIKRVGPGPEEVG